MSTAEIVKLSTIARVFLPHSIYMKRSVNDIYKHEAFASRESGTDDIFLFFILEPAVWGSCAYASG